MDGCNIYVSRVVGGDFEVTYECPSEGRCRQCRLGDTEDEEEYDCAYMRGGRGCYWCEARVAALESIVEFANAEMLKWKGEGQ